MRSSNAHDGAVAGAHAKLEARLEETRHRLDVAGKEMASIKAEHEAERAKASGRMAAARGGDVEKIRALERELGDLTARYVKIEAERHSQATEIDRLRTHLAKAKKPTPARVNETDDADWNLTDPLAMARALDLSTRALASRTAAGRFRPKRRADRGDQSDVWSPPRGLPPGDPAWIEWLESVDVPFWLVVDGHNVVFAISGDHNRTAESTRRLETALRRVRKRAPAPVRITVVYDSALAGDRVAPKAVGGLDIRFASRGVIADDEIVGLVETAQEPVVVVTSDRELQQRTRAGAQIVLDGRALAAYASGSTGR